MEATRGLTLSTKCEDNQVVIYANGELDFAATPALVATVMAASRVANMVCVLNCKEVTFIDSEAIKCILTLQRSLSIVGKKLLLYDCSREVARILALLGLSHLETGLKVESC